MHLPDLLQKTNLEAEDKVIEIEVEVEAEARQEIEAEVGARAEIEVLIPRWIEEQHEKQAFYRLKHITSMRCNLRYDEQAYAGEMRGRKAGKIAK